MQTFRDKFSSKIQFGVWRGFERLIFFRSVILLQILIIVHFSGQKWAFLCEFFIGLISEAKRS